MKDAVSSRVFKGLQAHTILTIAGLVSSVVFSVTTIYLSYLYVKQQLNVNVTHVFFSNEDHDLSMCVAFANTGNKASAIVRVNAVIWHNGRWRLLTTPLEGYGTLTTPDTPIEIAAGAVKIISLETDLPVEEMVSAEQPDGYTVIGVTVQTMNSDGTLYTSRYPVARFSIHDGKATAAEALIDESRNAFADLDDSPSNFKIAKLRMAGAPLTFVW